MKIKTGFIEMPCLMNVPSNPILSDWGHTQWWMLLAEGLSSIPGTCPAKNPMAINSSNFAFISCINRHDITSRHILIQKYRDNVSFALKSKWRAGSVGKKKKTKQNLLQVKVS